MLRIFKGPGIILQIQWDPGVPESSGIFFPIPQLCFLRGPCSQTGPQWWQSMATGPECGGGGENLQKEDRSSVARRREVWADKNNRSSSCSCAHFVDFIDVKVLKLGPVDSWYLYPLPFIWTLAVWSAEYGGGDAVPVSQFSRTSSFHFCVLRPSYHAMKKPRAHGKGCQAPCSS